RPIDPTRDAVHERYLRPCRLEVEEPLRVDVSEPLCLPHLAEESAGKRSALPTVIPPAKRGNENGVVQRRARRNAKFVGHPRSLRRSAATGRPGNRLDVAALESPPRVGSGLHPPPGIERTEENPQTSYESVPISRRAGSAATDCTSRATELRTTGSG